MIKKKEIYFSKDVFKSVGEKHSLHPKHIEKAFISFLTSFKKNIEETDSILYEMPYLGEMMITKGDSLRNMEKFRKRSIRTKDKAEKEKYKEISDRYKIRAKKITIELEKLKTGRKYLSKKRRKKMYARKFGLTNPDNMTFKKILYNTTIEEAIKMQNEYAYEYYKRNNLPITL